MNVIIQNRRGVYANVIPQRLLPGEVVVVTEGDPASPSGQSVYVGTKTGEVQRLAFSGEVSSANIQAQEAAQQAQEAASNTGTINTQIQEKLNTVTQLAGQVATNAQTASTAAQTASDKADIALDAKTDAETAAQTAVDVLDSMAPAYSTSATYAVGDLVIQDNQLYQCTTAITTAETWNPAHWTESTVENGLTNLKDELSDVENELYDGGEDTETELTFVSGKYINTGGSGVNIGDTIDVNNPGTYNTMRYAISDCTEGDRFRLESMQGAVSGRAWAFLTSANVLISRSDASQAVSGYITAPANAGKAVFNDNPASGSSGGKVYKVTGSSQVFILNNVVRFDKSQTLTDAQKAQARENIGVLQTSDYSIIDKEILSTTSGWRLQESNGCSVSDANYKLIKYEVKAGDYIKVISDDRFQFQNNASVPSSLPSNRVGQTYGTGTFELQVPDSASHLIISTPTTSNSHVYDAVKISELDYAIKTVTEVYKEGSDVTGDNLFDLAGRSTEGCTYTKLSSDSAEITVTSGNILDVTFHLDENYLQTILTTGKKYRLHFNAVATGTPKPLIVSIRNVDRTAAEWLGNRDGTGEYSVVFTQKSNYSFLWFSSESSTGFTYMLTDFWIKEVTDTPEPDEMTAVDIVARNKTIVVENENIKSNMTLVHAYDSTANTRYTIIRAFKQKIDGTYQYPFVRYCDPWSYTALLLSRKEGWDIIINCALEIGLTIQNGIVISDTTASTHRGVMPLTIDSNGDLSFTQAETTGRGQELVNQGIVSAGCGFFPIVNNYERYAYPTDIPQTLDPSWTRSQRQIIGQYSNGDYAIITAEARGFANSSGFTIEQAQDLCMNLGLKFAYNLDGGGSTQTVYGKKMVNSIYEGETGRYGRVFIVFNGSDTFSVPPV